MGAPKRFWQFLKIVAVLLSLSVTGLTSLFSYDTSVVAGGVEYETGTIVAINATHYGIPVDVSIQHTGFLYTFKMTFTIDVYVNTSVTSVLESSPIATFKGVTVIAPGQSVVLPITIELNQTIWDYASTVILGLPIGFSGILFDNPIVALNVVSFAQIK
ncbi:MAG: hypothetical protein ACTSYR_00730 [Candidatus Odinarchaeia archaeon]